MPDTVTGKKFVILGASSGIGFAVAKMVLEHGAAEVIIGSSNQDRVDRAVEKLQTFARSGAKVSGKTVDLRVIDNVPAFFEDIGQFDHFVSTAGSSLPKVQFPDNIDLNVARENENDRFWSVLRAIQCCYKKINEGGSITVTSGSVIKHPLPGWSALAGIAGAIETSTRNLALDLAPLRVNCVAPGFVLTELWDDMPKDQRDAMLAQAAKDLPVKHYGAPEEIAEAYLYLFKGTFTTGQTLYVEGGRAVQA